MILTLLGLMPGMPHFIILPMAAVAGFAAWKLKKTADLPVIVAPEVAEPTDLSKIGWDEVTDTCHVMLDIGYGLVPLVDERKGAPLMGRITGVRRQLSKDLGFVVPQVRVRDDINLAPYTYRIIIGGVVVGEDQVSPDEMLALDTGQAVGSLPGKTAKDPTFGLDAVWISPADADAATGAGYLVVDAGTVIATHLNQQLLTERVRPARPRRGPVAARRAQGPRRRAGRRALPAAAAADHADPGAARAARRGHPAQGIPPHRRRARQSPRSAPPMPRNWSS